MKDFIYYTPTEVVFGKDAESKTGEYALKFGKKALLVYGMGSVIKSGLLDKITASLDDANVSYVLFGGAKPNPTVEHARLGINVAIEENVDLVIGIGGGSAIDTAKAIAHGAANPSEDIWDIWTKKVSLTKSLPVGAILTIPAAGSEMSDSAVLTNTELGKKQGINTPFNRPKFSIVNPSYGATVSKYQLACGITDIMMHTMERYFIPGIKADLTDELAEGLLRTVIINGLIILDDPTNYDAMAEIFWASSLSHNGLTECGRGKDFSVHKLGHALSARYDVAHGASLSCVWGAWAMEVYSGAIERFARFARNVFNINLEDENELALEGIKKTVEFFKTIGMPTSLTELDCQITLDDIDALAMDATQNDTVKLSRIKPLGLSEVTRIYKNVL